MRTRTRAMLLSVLLGALCGCSSISSSHPASYYALGATSEPTANRLDDRRLDVMTFNMYHRDKPGELAVLSRHLRETPEGVPDFILCQEVVFGRHRSDGHESTAEVLAYELGYYASGTKRIADREGVAILSRYPFDYYAANHLDARTNALLLGFRRVSTMGEFVVPGVGRVRVVNVHFAHWGFEKHIRMQQMRETLAWIAARQRVVPADVTFLGGDFNAKPDSSVIALLQDAALTDPLQFASFNSDEPTKAGGRRSRPHKRIDYIFVAGPSCTLVSERLLARDGLEGPKGRVWLSDHLPVVHHYDVGAVRTAVVPTR